MKWLIFATALMMGMARADDWPQWLGPERDGVWREGGVRKNLPEEGAEVLWRAPVNWGYAGPAVANGKVYVPDFVIAEGEFDGQSQGGKNLKGKERILCLDAKSGKQLWVHEEEVTYAVSYPGGPRVTPTVQDGALYFQGTMGHVRCLDAESGELRWKKDMCQEYDTSPPRWGYASHPLVHGDLVYVLAGGDGSVLVALDKKTGRERWRALSAEEAGYCPPLVIEHGGVEQLLLWYPKAVASLNPANGKVYWSVDLEPVYGISRMAPRKWGNKLFVAGPGKSAAVMLELDDEKPAAKVLWRGAPKKAVYPLNSTPHLREGVIFGVDGETSALIAASMKDGERIWSNTGPTLAQGSPARSRHGTAFLVYHEENCQFWLFGEMGDLILAEMSADGYRQVGRQHLLEPTNGAWGRRVIWSHPAFALKSVFARNDKELIRVDLSAGGD